MRARHVRSLAVPASYVLTDGPDVPGGLACPGKAVVKGDARSLFHRRRIDRR